MYPTYIVYADVLFATNFFLDYGILWATARFGHLSTNRVYLGLAAFVGALYSIFMVYPQASILYAMSSKLLFSLLIIAIAFPKVSLRSFIQAALYFYLISFAMAGAVLGGSSIISNNTPIFQRVNIKVTGLFFALLTALALGRWGLSYIKRNWRKNQFRVSVEIFVNKMSVLLEALIDTGNELRDPLSQKPVLIVEYQAIKKILPNDFRDIFERYATGDITKVVESSGKSVWNTRIRIIPFHSIGKHNGMLIGIKPDIVTVFTERKIVTQDVIVCLYHKSLSSRGSYQAVLNPEMLEAAA
jgi:stage II sporulation protein GA (sporulation sigma-E factor processing peptidase)